MVPAEKLAPVGTCASPSPDSFPVAASGGAQLLKLRVEHLPVGRNAGIADDLL
jgi:hypothetical protein